MASGCGAVCHSRLVWKGTISALKGVASLAINAKKKYIGG